MARVFPVILAIALAIYAIADCARTPSDQLPGRLPKPLWLILIIMVVYLGPIAWIIASRVSQAEARGGAVSTGMWSAEEGLPLTLTRPDGRGSGRDTPKAPDDDPDFLFSLQTQIYRERKEREEREARERDAAHARDDDAEETHESTTERDHPGDEGGPARE
ncbi:PLDc_N domain-containing protein [Nanchangia anserum]|uniref:PLDc_N domain-containing protein n=1 Tax=Nanchangia anserum TaxID=2692125 RepID=A0A8I0G7L3_9ACTO|nr:PLD nuclease N-terminal domain-containing protein [Nanchangia anserum]MBD3689340.1 PLDc_N domain-containing protein [Nanchangia anserum]QOX81547.1 PLDc_N domain-containing protein [Nanchangia anserum]